MNKLSDHTLIDLRVNGEKVGVRLITYIRNICRTQELVALVELTNGYSHDWTETWTMDEWENKKFGKQGPFQIHLVNKDYKTGTTFFTNS